MINAALNLPYISPIAQLQNNDDARYVLDMHVNAVHNEFQDLEIPEIRSLTIEMFRLANVNWAEFCQLKDLNETLAYFEKNLHKNYTKIFSRGQNHIVVTFLAIMEVIANNEIPDHHLIDITEKVRARASSSLSRDEVNNYASSLWAQFCVICQSRKFGLYQGRHYVSRVFESSNWFLIIDDGAVSEFRTSFKGCENVNETTMEYNLADDTFKIISPNYKERVNELAEKIIAAQKQATVKESPETIEVDIGAEPVNETDALTVTV